MATREEAYKYISSVNQEIDKEDSTPDGSDILAKFQRAGRDFIKQEALVKRGLIDVLQGGLPYEDDGNEVFINAVVGEAIEQYFLGKKGYKIVGTYEDKVAVDISYLVRRYFKENDILQKELPEDMLKLYNQLIEKFPLEKYIGEVHERSEYSSQQKMTFDDLYYEYWYWENIFSGGLFNDSIASNFISEDHIMRFEEFVDTLYMSMGELLLEYYNGEDGLEKSIRNILKTTLGRPEEMVIHLNTFVINVIDYSFVGFDKQDSSYDAYERLVSIFGNKFREYLKQKDVPDKIQRAYNQWNQSLWN